MTDASRYGPVPSPSGWRCWGNEAVVADFQRAAMVGPSHAYIIGGQDHVGKATLASEFARALLCIESPGGGLSCGHCSACRRVLRGVHPDVTHYDLASQALDDRGNGKQTTLTIKTVRGIASSLAMRPLEGRWRVVVVDDAEVLQGPAQEAFLKTLEEPPPYAVIVILCTDPELLLETVRSRCQTTTLQPVPMPTIQACLAGAGVDKQRASEIAALAEGLPGWAFRAANDMALVNERAELRTGIARWIEGTPYDRIVAAVHAADQFGRDRSAAFDRLDALLGMWRSVLLRRAGLEVQLGSPSASIRSDELATSCSLSELVAAVRSVQVCMSDLQANVRPRLAFESMVLQWPTLPSAS